MNNQSSSQLSTPQTTKKHCMRTCCGPAARGQRGSWEAGGPPARATRANHGVLGGKNLERALKTQLGSPSKVLQDCNGCFGVGSQQGSAGIERPIAEKAAWAPMLLPKRTGASFGAWGSALSSWHGLWGCGRRQPTRETAPLFLSHG